MSNLSSPLFVRTALVIVQIIFGLNYLTSKVIVSAVPPLIWASFRLTASTVIMFVVALALRQPHPTLQKGKKIKTFFWPMVGLALGSTFLNQIFFLEGIERTTATNSAILNTTIPIFTLITVIVMGHEKLTWKRGLGFLVALTGVLALRRIEDFKISSVTFVGDMLTLANCLSYSLFLVFSKKFVERFDGLWTTAWLFGYGAIGMNFVTMGSWKDFSPPPIQGVLMWSLIYATLLGTVVVYFLNNWALRFARSSEVAFFVYLQPVVAAIAAWIWFDEAVTTRSVTSCCLIALGVLLTQWKTRIKKLKPAPGEATT